MSSRLAGLLLAALVILGGCGGDDGDGTQDGSALAVLVDSLLPSLEQLAGLEARAPVEVAVRSPEQVRAFVEIRMRDDFPPREIEAVRDVYALLGLIPDTLDLRRLLTDLYAEQIVGYYDPDSTTLYVIDGVPREALRPVLAHELVHALQDQHVDLDSLIDRSRGNDRQLAAQAAIEGHATLVMLAFLAGEMSGQPVDPATLPDPADQIRAGLTGASAYPVFQSAPRLLREVLIFPYAEGASFAWSVWAARPAEDRPPFPSLIPSSTEQVLAPERHFLTTVDAPTPIELDSGVAAGFDIVYENTLGAFESRLFLELLGTNAEAATGWDGDRYILIENDQERRALLWWSVWDDDAAADAFAAAARAALAQTGRVADVRRIDAGRPGLVVRIAGAGFDPALLPGVTLSCSEDGTDCEVRPDR